MKSGSSLLVILILASASAFRNWRSIPRLISGISSSARYWPKRMRTVSAIASTSAVGRCGGAASCGLAAASAGSIGAPASVRRNVRRFFTCDLLAICHYLLLRDRWPLLMPIRRLLIRVRNRDQGLLAPGRPHELDAGRHVVFTQSVGYRNSRNSSQVSCGEQRRTGGAARTRGGTSLRSSSLPRAIPYLANLSRDGIHRRRDHGVIFSQKLIDGQPGDFSHPLGLQIITRADARVDEPSELRLRIL